MSRNPPAVTPITIVAVAVLAVQSAAAQDRADWDVAAPPLPTRDVFVDVTEGTWMSLDVSPDGATIAFDLLGDLYTMPIGGGEATAISSGMPWEIQPRFSPDGSMVAFALDPAHDGSRAGLRRR